MSFINEFYEILFKRKKQKPVEKFTQLQKRPMDWTIDMGNTNIPIQYRVSFMGMNDEDKSKFLDAVYTDMQNGKLKNWK